MTMDRSVAEKLKGYGFRLLSDRDGKFIFENCNSLNFSGIDKSKVTYTNILCI